MNITKAFMFEAAHRLPRVAETHRCFNLHGHTYRVELTMTGEVDSYTGFVVDFFDVEQAFVPVLTVIDHHYLNEVPGLENPTVENISAWIYRKLLPWVPALSAVRVYENPECWADFVGPLS